MDVEVGRRAEALDQRDRAAVGVVCLQASLPEQETRDHAVHNLQHGRHQQGPRSQQQAQRDRQQQHPLAHRHVGDDVVHQVGRRLRHAPGTARGAEPAPLAAEGDQLVVAAVTAAQAQEAVGQDAAFEEGVEAMIAAADQPDSGIDDGQVASNALTMLLAGEDTTANTLAWMIHLLWRHPAMLNRAVAEVREVTDVSADANANTTLTMEQMADLPFVEACIHETMRLKPVAPMLPLQATKDITIGDVLIPAGRVVINLMRRDSVSESHLPNAAAFDPTRWLADGGPAAQASAVKRISMPFGAGPRICPGRYLAMLEMKIAMATLLGRFDIVAVDTPDGGEAREHLSFTMLPVGLTMQLRERG